MSKTGTRIWLSVAALVITIVVATTSLALLLADSHGGEARRETAAPFKNIKVGMSESDNMRFMGRPPDRSVRFADSGNIGWAGWQATGFLFIIEFTPDGEVVSKSIEPIRKSSWRQRANGFFGI